MPGSPDPAPQHSATAASPRSAGEETRSVGEKELDSFTPAVPEEGTEKGDTAAMHPCRECCKFKVVSKLVIFLAVLLPGDVEKPVPLEELASTSEVSVHSKVDGTSKVQVPSELEAAVSSHKRNRKK